MASDQSRPGVLLWSIVILIGLIVLLVVVALVVARSPTGKPDAARVVAHAAPAETPAPVAVVGSALTDDADLDDILAPADVPGIQVLRSVGYCVGYEAARHRPRWAVYGLSARKIATDKQPPRPTWSADVRVPDPRSDDDWVGCGRLGYDRGHLAPSEALWSRHGRTGWQGTYVLTNAVPQRRGMNGGRWAQLEALLAGRGPAAAGLAGQCGYLAVAVVPIYDDAADLDGDGDGRDALRLRRPVEIPDAVAAIALDRTQAGYRGWGWITPNTDAGELRRVSISEIERACGQDFNDELPVSAQRALEAAVSALP